MSTMRSTARDFRAAVRMNGGNHPYYLGWIGHGNLGDEAIYEAQQQYFETSFSPFPTYRQTEVLRWARRLRRSPFPTRILLGGGTVVGRPEWLERLLRHKQAAGGQRVTVWGAGVEDPTFHPGGRFASKEALLGWAQALSTCSVVGVRGPLSVSTLADVGLDATVVGDPALRLKAQNPQPVVPGRVAINVARAEASYLGESDNLLPSVSSLATSILAGGGEVQFFAMHPSDLPLCEQLTRSCRGATLLPLAPSVQIILTQLSGASVVVSQRLHGNVLAAALNRPFVSLDYRPKCADFASSVAMGEFNLNITSLRAGDLTSRVRFLLDCGAPTDLTSSVNYFRQLAAPQL